MTELEHRAWNVASRAVGNSISPGVTALCVLAGVPVGPSAALGALAGSLTEEGVAAIGQLRRQRAGRVEYFADMAARAAGCVLDELLAAAAASPLKLELLAQTVDAASRSLHDAKIDILAAMAADGIRDDALVDDILIMVDAVRQLEVPHLRLLAVLARRDGGWTPGDIGEVDPGIVPALDGLAAKLQGLALCHRVDDGSGSEQDAWRLTRFGRQCVAYLAERGTPGG